MNEQQRTNDTDQMESDSGARPANSVSVCRISHRLAFVERLPPAPSLCFPQHFSPHTLHWARVKGSLGGARKTQKWGRIFFCSSSCADQMHICVRWAPTLSPPHKKFHFEFNIPSSIGYIFSISYRFVSPPFSSAIVTRLLQKTPPRHSLPPPPRLHVIGVTVTPVQRGASRAIGASERRCCAT